MRPLTRTEKWIIAILALIGLYRVIEVSTARFERWTQGNGKPL